MVSLISCIRVLFRTMHRSSGFWAETEDRHSTQTPSDARGEADPNGHALALLSAERWLLTPGMQAPSGLALLELDEKQADDDFLRHLRQWRLGRLLELEAGGSCGTERQEGSPDLASRNHGYRDRRLEARTGSPDSRIPRLRAGTFYASSLRPRNASVSQRGTTESAQGCRWPSAW